MDGKLSRAEFEKVVADALATLPPRFAKLVDNVVFTVEDEPDGDDLDSVDDGEDGDGELLGIYRGVPLTERDGGGPLGGGPVVPDEVAIFRGPILRVAANRADAVAHVRDTVIHELGHYFGLGDDDMPR